MSTADPDAFALASVQQYLHEQGWMAALQAVEKAAGRRHQDGAVLEPSQLMQLVWQHCAAAEEAPAGTHAATIALGETGDAASQRSSAPLQLESRRLLARAQAAVPAQNVSTAMDSSGVSAAVAGVPVDVDAEVEALRRAAVPMKSASSSTALLEALPANPTAMCTDNDGSRVFMGLGSGEVLAVRLTDDAASVHESWRRPVARAGILSVAWNGNQPAAAARGDERVGTEAAASMHGDSVGAELLACGSMDGTVTLVAAEDGTTVASLQLNARLITKVVWCWLGGWAIGHTHADSQSDCYVAAATGAATLVLLRTRSDSLQLAQSVPFAQNVADMLPLHSSRSTATGTHDALVVAVKGSNRLRCYRAATPAADGFSDGCGSSDGEVIAVQDEAHWNMNEKGDDHVSFSAARLQLAPSARHLLVCTAEGAMRVYALPRRLHQDAALPLLTRIDSVHTDTFFVPCACWHSGGGVVLAANAGGAIEAFDGGSGRKLATLQGHKGSVRGMAMLPTAVHAANLKRGRRRLLTASFDKMLRVWPI